MYKINTEKLTVGYKGKSIVDDINININKGEIVVLIGPNGAGKSTILKSIAGQLRNLSGNIFIDNEDLSKIKITELSRKLSFVSTDRIKQEMITCKEVVSLGRYPYTDRFGNITNEDEKKITEAIIRVNAIDISENEYSKVSDGQKQKIKIAMAICQEPEIIILDEPTSFLDIKHKLEILSILKSMACEGVTVIMSLHEIEFARMIADTVIGIKDNRVCCYGKNSEIFKEEVINDLYGLDEGVLNSLYVNY